MIEPIFDETSLTLLLKISTPIKSIKKLQSRARRWRFSAKEEFHLTVIGTKTARILKELSETDIAAKIEKVLAKIDWKYSLNKEILKIRKSYYRTDAQGESQKETRESIIQMIDLTGLDQFYKKMNSTFKTKIDLPVPHITLFSKSTDKRKQLRGIGVYSKEDLLALRPEEIS